MQVGDLIPIGAVGNATKDKVLEGNTFSSEIEGVDIAGAMANNGAVNYTITHQNGQFIIPKDYHNGSGKVIASFANLTPPNIRDKVNVGGVVGTLEAAIAYPGTISPIIISNSKAGVGSLNVYTLPSNWKTVMFVSDGITPNSSNTLTYASGRDVSNDRYCQSDIMFCGNSVASSWSYHDSSGLYKRVHLVVLQRKTATTATVYNVGLTEYDSRSSSSIDKYAHYTSIYDITINGHDITLQNSAHQSLVDYSVSASIYGKLFII